MVTQRTLTPLCEGSIPIPSRFRRVAQLVERFMKM